MASTPGIEISGSPFYDAQQLRLHKTGGLLMGANVERRAGMDRRVRDVGAPSGMGERRMHAERRLPTPQEARISDADWEKYFGSVARKPGDNN